MKLSAIFFDMGGTLERFWHNRELRLRATPELNQILEQNGIFLHLEQEALFNLVSEGYKRYHQWSIESMEELPPEQVWGQYILKGKAFPVEKLTGAAEELMYFIENRFYQRALRPEVPGVLEAIRNMGLKMGLISNVCSRNLVPDNLKKYGIIDHFSPIILSCRYGRRKPDPAIFHEAARLAEVPTSECLYIGDRIARDVVGSRRAGYQRSIQIVNDFDHGEEDHGAQPDAVVKDMDEFLEVLKSELARPSGRQTSTVRALLFDAGDILYFRPERGRYFREFREREGLNGREISKDVWADLKGHAYRGVISREQYLLEGLRLYGVTDPAQVERGYQALEKDDNNIQFYEGVSQTLHQLKKAGFLLAIITDTAMPVYGKLRWFERGGFGEVWDAIISSMDVGVEKPDARIYQAALRQLGVNVKQAVFVGHHVEELDGAQVLGMQTIAFNHAPGTRADFYLDAFADILKLPFVAPELVREG